MSNIFYLTRVQSEPGAKLYFYASGTSTPQDTYQDIDLTTAHANPVVADAEGYFDPIYLDPALPNYRYTLTDADDAVLEGPIDDVATEAVYTDDFVGTGGGFDGSVTFNCSYTKSGPFVNLVIPSGSGTGNDAFFTISGVPVAIRPASPVTFPVHGAFNATSALTTCHATLGTDGEIDFFIYSKTSAGESFGTWSSIALKGLGVSLLVNYSVL